MQCLDMLLKLVVYEGSTGLKTFQDGFWQSRYVDEEIRLRDMCERLIESFDEILSCDSLNLHVCVHEYLDDGEIHDDNGVLGLERRFVDDGFVEDTEEFLILLPERLIRKSVCRSLDHGEIRTHLWKLSQFLDCWR